MNYLAAAIQFEPAWGEPAANLERLLELSGGAADEGARLVVWPEMATTGYIFADRAEIAPFVETIPGPTTKRIARFCRERRVYLVAGLAERDAAQDTYHNSAVLIDPSGSVLGVYRKTHLWKDDVRWAVAGDEFPVWQTPLGRLAMLICRDADFPEAARLVARRGAQVVLHPTNWLGAAPSPTWRTRAAENGLYWVSTSRWGEERGVQFSGGTCIIGPRGEVLDVRARGDGWALAPIQPADEAADGRTTGDAAAAADLESTQELLLNPHLYRSPKRAWEAGHVWVVQAGRCPSTPEMVRQEVEQCLAQQPTAAPPQLVVLPPLVAAEDVRGARDVAAWAEPVPGPASDWLLERARGLGATVVSQLLEWDDGDLYLTVVAVGPDGVQAKARASRVQPEAAAWCGVGRGPGTLDLPIGRVGLLSEYELRQPEPLRLLAQRGCRVVAVPASGRQGQPWLWTARAEEDDLFLAVAAREDGGSLVYGDRRQEAAAAPLAGSAVCSLSLPERVGRVDDKPSLRMRPVHLYRALLDPPQVEDAAAPAPVRRRAGR